MAKKLVIANWKRYIESPEEAKRLAQALRRKAKNFAGVEVWLAPQAPLLPVVVAAIKGSKLRAGAQALSRAEGPQHTGEVSGTALRAAGASFVLVGHSERRALGETASDVRAQVAQAAQGGLVPVLCVGEAERSADGSHFSVIAEQLRSALVPDPSRQSGAEAERPGSVGKVVVAYEPLWAIGKSAAAAMPHGELEETVLFVRKTLADIAGRNAALKVPILYGGSVEGENAAALLPSGIAGFLVGHASAQEKSFLEILKAVRTGSR